MNSEKKPTATITAIIFSGLSLIISIGALWDRLVVTYKWPLWYSRGFFAAPGWLFNIICVGIAILSIIVALCNREQRKKAFWIAILMLIPGILYAVYYLLLAWGYGRMG